MIRRKDRKDAMPTDPTPTPNPDLPAGFDDPASPWWIEPELRDRYQAPGLDEMLKANGTILFLPSPPQPAYVDARGRTHAAGAPDEQAAARHAQLVELADDVRFKAHLGALDRARDAAERAAREHAEHARWLAAHRCAVCGVLDAEVGARRLLDLPAGGYYGTPPVRVEAQTCQPCAIALLAQLLADAAADRLDDGRTRAAAAAAWLAG